MSGGTNAPEVPRTGAGIAAVLALILLATSGAALWVTLHACGITLLSERYLFPWCQARTVAEVRLAEAEARHLTLRRQLHDAELALMTPEACGPEVEPLPVVVPPPPEPEPEPEPEPAPEPEPEPAPEPEPEPQEEEQAQICEPDQEYQPAQEVALVMDGSGSMQYSVDVPVELEARYIALDERLARIPPNNFLALLNAAQMQQELAQLEQQLRSYPGRSRIDVARQVMVDTTQQAPSELGMNLTVFGACNEIRTNRYAPAQRPQLINRIRGVEARAGTPLASAMRQAAQSLELGDNPDDAVNMVLITDGADSCGGDPCQTARQLKQQKPGLIINVIDMSQTDKLRCVADITGGSYQRHRGADTQQLTEALKEASGYSGSGQCRPATPRE